MASCAAIVRSRRRGAALSRYIGSARVGPDWIPSTMAWLRLGDGYVNLMTLLTPPRSLHEPHHSWMLPTKQTGSGAEARKALPDFSGEDHAVVRQRHEAISVAELAFAFWALAKCLR
jgi:hypothetical protein